MSRGKRGIVTQKQKTIKIDITTWEWLQHEKPVNRTINAALRQWYIFHPEIASRQKEIEWGS